MKQTWKKIVGLILVAVSVFALSACQKAEEESFQRITDDMAASCSQVSTSVVESLSSFDEATLEQFRTNRDDFTRLATEEWIAKTAELGAYVSMGEAEVSVNHEEEQITVKIPAVFANNEGVVSVVFNYNKDYDQMIPAYMTIAEAETFAGNMAGAGINTVMGVGTVFVVLIFLIFVISLFKYVNRIGANKQEAVQAPKAAPAPVHRAASAVEEEEELTDDLELVAVIAAAIAAAENTSTDGFVVRSIKKVNRSRWQRA